MTTRIRLALIALGPLLFALISLAMGKKTGWDFYNYHWYNPFALLNERFGFDVAVAHHATYYNPLSDVPLYLIGRLGPAWIGGLFTGAMAGLVVSLIGAMSYYALPINAMPRNAGPIKNERHRVILAVTLALLGAFGAGAFQEIGDPANDVPAAIGSFIALLILLANITALEQSTINRSTALLLLFAGFSSGAAVGLKLTTAIFAVGIGAAVLALSGDFKTRLLRLALFGVGSLIGLLLLGGFWMWHMWHFSGNPFFPYFNDFFQSPLLVATGYLDPSFRPDDWHERLLFPFLFTFDSHYVSESTFRDGHVLALYVLLPVSLLIAWIFKRRAAQPQIKVLFAFAAACYITWLAIFDIYRYLIPLEMLSPLLIALAYSLWPIAIHWRIAITAITLVVLQLLVKVDISDRQPWAGPYVHVDVPSLQNPEHSMILMTGHEPMAYVIPFFPREIPFVRIDGWLVHGSDHTTGLARAMRERVAATDSDLYVLFSTKEQDAAIKATEHYNLKLIIDSGRCHIVIANIGNPLSLCPAQRR